MPFYAEEPKAVNVQSTSSGRSNNGSSLPIRVFSGLALVSQVTEVHDDDPRHSSSCHKRGVESDFVSSYPSSKKLKTVNIVDEPKIPPRILQQAQKAKISDFKFDTDGYAICYTDGSCVTNLKTSGVGVWFGKDHVANISEPLPVPGTSNRAELTAILYAIHAAKAADETRVSKWISSDENGDADELAKAGAAESLRIYGSVAADASTIMMTSSNADDEASIRVNDYSTVQCNPVVLLHAHGPSSTTHFPLDGSRKVQHDSEEWLLPPLKNCTEGTAALTQRASLARSVSHGPCGWAALLNSFLRGGKNWEEVRDSLKHATTDKRENEKAMTRR
ncbi:unnamed protein product [Notodromas monacha]|uniref:RNase H type-1 domain-containing protein n=1 Tax=Notodromas monacha TaxID=399045 RepID=A0A7R9BRW2_9CRUS|nr:unnamed protein product [Notodromas monacha]CAG0919190.1 unnamed protein product [Notodromas monacha]